MKSMNKVIAGVNEALLYRGSINPDPSHRLEEDLCFDSLDVAELVLELEERFSIKIPDNVYMKWRTVQDVYNTVDVCSTVHSIEQRS